MEIRKISVDKLNPVMYNPRKDLKPGDPEYDKLLRSIEEFGYIDPIIWNEQTGNIVGGHQRLKILIANGYKEVDVSVVSLDADREKALNIALNKISGDWDEEKLAKLLKELSDSNIDVEITGFDMDEVEELINEYNLIDVKEDDYDVDQALDEIEEPITKRGDIWLLGKHRLLCGDSTSANDVKLLMDGKKAQLITTDPPYNVNYEGTNGLKIQNDNMEDEAFYYFLLSAFECMFESAEEGCPIYVFHADTEGLNFRKAFKHSGFKLAECLIWVKNSLVLGRQDYHWRHEPILYGWKEGAAHSWYGQRDKATVIEDEANLQKLKKDELIELVKTFVRSVPQSVIYFDKPSKNSVHPTMKPLGLIGYLIGNSSKKGDIVQDLFGGSGSTLMACEQTERKCYTIELDEKYCDVIVKRYIEYKGKPDEVYLIRDNRKVAFNEIEKR